MSVDDVALAMGKDQATVASWESGAASPTYVQLENLAYVVFKRPVALFFFPEPPEEKDPRQSFRTLPDAEIDNLSAHTRYLAREAQAQQLSLEELTAGKNPTERHILHDLTISRDAARAASQVRDYLGVDFEVQAEDWRDRTQALKEWRAVVEEVGVFVFKHAFKQKDVWGFSLFDTEFPLVVVNNSTAVSKQIFTLFHELGHLLVHVSGITKEDDRYVRTLKGESRRLEIFCNQFAADLPLPGAFVKEALKSKVTDSAVAALADRFKVSREVVLRRTLDLGLVTRQYYERKAAAWKKQYEQERKKKAQTGGGGNYYNTQATYLSQRYAQLAFSEFYRGAMPVEQLADFLSVKVKSVSGLEQALLKKAIG